MNVKSNVEKDVKKAYRVWWIKAAFFIVLLVALLIGIPGDTGWIAAWIYIAVMALNMIISTFFLEPDLVIERTDVDIESVPRWDMFLARGVALFAPLSTWLVCAFDARNGWSPELHIGWLAAGLALVILGNMLTDWSMATNRFFSAVVRIQTDRGHQVVDRGPYSVIRHPGYSGALLFYLGTPLLLGSWWAFIPVFITAILFYIRTALEDRKLQDELEGYRDYAGRVRSRIIPGIW